MRTGSAPAVTRVLAAIGLVAMLAMFDGAALDARDPLVSPYTYAEHVFAIVRDRCGVCHEPEGAATSLLSYADAVEQAEQIRAQLTSAAMPPWFVTAVSPVVRGGHTLPNRERDILITWAAGGTPAGDLSTLSPFVSTAPAWRAGTPDRVLDLPAAALPPDSTEGRRTFTVATGFQEDAWVRGIEVLPSERSMVRMVTVALADGPVLAAWVPGETMTSTPPESAFRVPARASLKVDVRYRRHRSRAAVAQTVRLRIGLHLARTGSVMNPVTTLMVEDAPPLKTPVRVLAVRAVFSEALDAVRVEAALPDGQRIPLLDLRGVQPDWGRRYWLADPVDLPAGATVSVHVSGDNPAIELLVVSPDTPPR